MTDMMQTIAISGAALLFLQGSATIYLIRVRNVLEEKIDQHNRNLLRRDDEVRFARRDLDIEREKREVLVKRYDEMERLCQELMRERAEITLEANHAPDRDWET